MITAHVEALVAQLALIIADGVQRGEFAVDDPYAGARAVFDATGRFHNPFHAAEWSDPDIDPAMHDVCSLILRGLAAPARSAPRTAAGRGPLAVARAGLRPRKTRTSDYVVLPVARGCRQA